MDGVRTLDWHGGIVGEADGGASFGASMLLRTFPDVGLCRLLLGRWLNLRTPVAQGLSICFGSPRDPDYSRST